MLLRLAFVAPLLLAGMCSPLQTLPALVSATPIDGAADVGPADWIALRFAAPVANAASITLGCNGVDHPVTTTRVDDTLVVLNPLADLPAASACAAEWLGPDGPTALAFTTAAAGAPAEIVYDRSDPRSFGPVPDDVLLAIDATTPSGFRVAVPPPTIAGGPFEQALVNGLTGAGNEADGWSPVSFVGVELTDALDPASLPTSPEASLDPLASIGWFDLTPGSPTQGHRIPFLADLRSDLDPRTGITHHTLLLFPSVRLTPEGRYGVVVTRRARAGVGRPLAPSAAFAAVLGAPQEGEPTIVADARAVTDDLLANLDAAIALPYDRQDIALALRMTIRSEAPLAADMLALRAAIDALPAPTLSIERTTSAAFPDLAAEVRGTFAAPDFRNPGTARLERDANGLPVQVGTRNVPFVLAIPNASLSGPSPLIFYMHGNPGSAEEVPGNVAGRSGTDGLSLADRGFAMIGFTDAINSELGQDLGVQSQAVLLTLIAQSDVPDYDVQSWAEQISFVKLLETLGSLDVVPLPSGDGVPDLDVSELLYLGISQGAIKGSATMSYLPEIRAASLVVGGARDGELLVHQAEFTGLLDTLQASVPLLTPSEIWIGLGGYQLARDPQDPHNHAQYLYRAPHALGTPARASVLIVEGIGDSLVPNHGTRALANLIGPVLQVEPVQQSSPVVSAVPGPLAANVNATTTAGYYQYVPGGIPGLTPTPGCDVEPEGHFCPQSAAVAIDQRVRFFESALSESAPVVIDPLSP